MDDLPGYRMEPYVTGFLATPAGRIPQVATQPSWRDALGICRARLGLARDRYRVNPGLYALGTPDAHAPVLVTANSKLSFDAVRWAMHGRHAWLLVVDTRGINVWCAGGKGTFNAAAVIEQIQRRNLARIVAHRRLILPQLCANGVRARDISAATGFRAQFGPIRAADLPQYLDGHEDPAMRRVTFHLAERAVLIPVEWVLHWKLLLICLAMTLLCSLAGGPGSSLVQRTALAATALGLGTAAGTTAFPLLLPWLPRAFSVGGAMLGAVASLLLPQCFPNAPGLTLVGAGLWSTALASWLALDFTGATPYTAPSGVEHEMRRAIPAQVAAALVGTACVVAGNLGGWS